MFKCSEIIIILTEPISVLLGNANISLVKVHIQSKYGHIHITITKLFEKDEF